MGYSIHKIKNGLGCFFKKIEDVDGTDNKMLTINKNLVSRYLGSIDISRVAKPNRESVEEYKEKFISFINDETSDIDLDVFDSYIEQGIAGMKKLVIDVSKINYRSGFDYIADILNFFMKDENLTIDQLKMSNKIHDIADYLSRNQSKLK